ncbi:hypothetical protein [Sphingopyxis witflariensis]|uniref:Uncharacterized protein n=1 Tax=Sphingopyxis witflariensis TaxID=173675 RepID=A0A246JYJ4_9SPHN|nr:hypothetical protein [Sphingopyxis witflariensis]OWQ97990.1 hypothetical protein CDQ91_10240 [Sphingopyxis witflariensis]
MTAQHTPGPWVIEDGWLQNERGPFIDGQYLSVCMSATRLADGNLITAAPDMKAALEHILAGALWLPRFAEEEARAALAKARGEVA